MAKGTRGRRRIASRQCRPTPYPLPSYKAEGVHQKNFSKIFKKDWEDARCSVCMECPHNAVLLLCSSHEKGCRPYMCGTSFRYSNCLDQYKKAYTKAEAVVVTESQTHLHHNLLDDGLFSGQTVGNSKAAELSCPLCRGQVKGWTIVEPAREYLNANKRNCMQDNCSFVGTYKELRKHVRTEHPSAKPLEVDPTLEQKWRTLEREREREDVMSTIRASMPGAVVYGDYVIEGNNRYVFDSEDGQPFDVDWNNNIDVGIDPRLMPMFLFLQAFGSAGIRRTDRYSNASSDRNVSRENSLDSFDYTISDDDNNGNNSNNGASLANRLRRQGRVLLGRSGRRRRRHGEGNGGRRTMF